MKTLFLSLVFLASLLPARAQDTFAGLKAVLTEAEWKRAGLEQLTPDEIGVIDAALIRHFAQRAPAAAEGLTPSVDPARKPGWLERFGLPTFDSDWREVPPLRAKVVAWETRNRFRLDNGQVWEGFEPIRMELVGRSIEIQARPRGQYGLVVEGTNTAVRVYRLR